MLEINLLSKEGKKSWKIYILSRVLIFAGFFSVIAALIFSMVLFVYKIKIDSSLKLAKDRIYSSQGEGIEQEKKMKEEVEKVNSKIAYFNKISEEHSEISAALKKISDIIPKSSVISNINITSEKENFAMVVKGISASRVSFLRLKDLIEKDGNFYDIESPLSNITQKENVEFVISAKIKPSLMESSSK